MLGHEHLITTLLYVNQRARDADSDLAQALEAIERGIGDKRR
jgi:hypothetical protein